MILPRNNHSERNIFSSNCRINLYRLAERLHPSAPPLFDSSPSPSAREGRAGKGGTQEEKVLDDSLEKEGKKRSKYLLTSELIKWQALTPSITKSSSIKKESANPFSNFFSTEEKEFLLRQLVADLVFGGSSPSTVLSTGRRFPATLHVGLAWDADPSTLAEVHPRAIRGRNPPGHLGHVDGPVAAPLGHCKERHRGGGGHDTFSPTQAIAAKTGISRSQFSLPYDAEVCYSSLLTQCVLI
ncbi:uncharacterized protein CEXT_642691 [Caerostris extrusa]|uniref:Uncharacterized protein n=1 Tax=Caerostris extrusa TaxID=172846 RepID=A0AAV4RCG2_CAEEX|nr:uncharacterized protein CEXT_642691 [Caerostris extrusa]